MNALLDSRAAAAHASPDTAAPLLVAEGLTLTSTRHGHQAAVLRDISIELARGRTLCLVGDSGAGKSMLGRFIARQLPGGFAVSAGRLLFGGRDLLAMPVAEHRELLGRRIAFIPQEPMAALNPVLTIGQQFGEHLMRQGVARGAWRERAIDLLDEVRLKDPARVLDRHAFELSGGMCQRVMIAMAFSSDPDLVISDEATTALDASTQAHIVTLIRKLQQRRGTGVIFVTHDLALATHVCDDLAVLYAGEVVERGPARQVSAQALHPYAKALHRAHPSLDGERRYLVPLAGQMPGISEFATLAGCRFVARCSVALESCGSVVPLLETVDADRSVRCVHGDQAPDEIALDPADLQGLFDGPRMSETPFIRVQQVARTYTTRSGLRRKSVDAVKGISFDVAPGEFVGIVGESGSGKSTLARLIMGLEATTRGEIVLNGQPLGHDDADWSRRIASIQMIFQDPKSALNPRRRIGSLLTQTLENRPQLHADRRTRALELVADIGLPPDTLERYPNQMSGGQRQRVNIGRALCDLPQLLVADEIVSGLDVSIQAQILNLLLRLRRERKISLLLISHDLAVVRYLCTRIIVMRDGEVVESGDTRAVLAAPSHPYTRSLLDAVPPSDPQRAWPTA
ncbi:ABC transporter ATP-binding protein [soil metagenome]